MSKVRVRFAPSPTGYVHVGNARTALFNWLFARHHGGVFVLRIEDTDVERSHAAFEARLMDDLRWLGLDWDEGPDKDGPFGPYRQSERKKVYAQYSTQLLDMGQAYFCFCSAEQLEAEREDARKAGRQPKYSGRCRKLPREEAARKVAAGEPAAVRLKIVESVFAWKDLVHGPTSFSSEVIGDPILVRSDGHPAYNYAVVIDDRLMEISHVIRGDDHISNTPRQLALYRALGWVPPEFAHLSTILGADRTRLSKRHGVVSLQHFREQGIRPDALRNYLLLLGWSAADGKTESFSSEEMIAKFSLDRVHKNPAVFDDFKLKWLNRQYFAEAPIEDKLNYYRSIVRPYLLGEGFLTETEIDQNNGWIDGVIESVIVDRVERVIVQDVFRMICGYDAERIVKSEDTRHVAEDAASREVLRALVPRVLVAGDIDYARFREVIGTIQRDTGKKGKELFHPIRVALTGAISGPELERLIPIFEAGAKLALVRRVKSTVQRLCEFAKAAGL